MIAVKLKHKAEYCSQVLFEPVRPSFVGRFLRFLKQFNHFYGDIEIDLENISENLANFGHKTGNLHEKMMKNISEPLDIILDQKHYSDVTNNSEL